ncbi:MAG: glycosyltransferase family 4 protein [Bacillota bacterium]
MRVLFVSRPAEGGMKRHLELLQRELKSRGVDTAVAGPDGGDGTRYSCDVADGIRPRSDLLARRQIKAAISHFRPDLIHYHGFKAALLGRSLRTGEVPAVCTLHGFMLRDGAYRHLGALMVAAERWQSHRTRAYIAVSDALKRHYVQSVGLPEAKITVIPNPVDVPAGERKSLRPARTVQVVGTSGRLVPEKGIDMLIDALRILGGTAPIQLLIAGEGPEREQLERRVKASNLESKVTFLGHVDDMNSFFETLDIYVQPSVSEGFGMACAEAMAAGVPVLVSDAGGLAELAGYGEFGLVFRAGCVEELSDALALLLAEEGLRDDLGAKGRQSILTRFSPSVVADRTVTLYRSVVAGTAR